MQLGKIKYFLDSTTLIHAVDKSAAYHKECLETVDKVAKGKILAATNLETLEETLFILSKFISMQNAIRITRDYLIMPNLTKLELKKETFEHALEILETTPLKRPKDAINVATMLEHYIPTIISEDKEYDKVTQLILRLHPKDLP